MCIRDSYGNPDYWERQYTKEFKSIPTEDGKPYVIKQFDWYQRYEGVKDIVTQYITPESKILNVGCGSSRMSEEMVDSGYKNIINIDISQVLIEAMQDFYKDLSLIHI
eukprot:TRINITY_DN6023_c0_g1_i9.p1 TRINITY_DN6023_c0_g1~~TRINITY_DN6023_c0_g1_i9.p1  ORF type:complete len:108 (+),score=36.40 TRINITY_DN6023_c0_g1_i9:148-471(+)